MNAIEKEATKFAEWMNIVCIRSDKHVWLYEQDFYSKKYSTEEMYRIFKDLKHEFNNENQKECKKKH